MEVGSGAASEGSVASTTVARIFVIASNYTSGLSEKGQELVLALEQIQAFSIPGGIPKSREQCESSIPWGMEGDHGAGLQPGFA
jgi:hypothetical protein